MSVDKNCCCRVVIEGTDPKNDIPFNFFHHDFSKSVDKNRFLSSTKKDCRLLGSKKYAVSFFSSRRYRYPYGTTIPKKIIPKTILLAHVPKKRVHFSKIKTTGSSRVGRTIKMATSKIATHIKKGVLVRSAKPREIKSSGYA